MKKSIALLLALLLTAGCAGAAFADEYEEEIRFQGIPWTESLQWLINTKRVEDETVTPAEAHDVANYLYGATDTHRYNTSIVVAKSLPVSEAAGYELDEAYMLFVKVPDDKGNVMNANASRLKPILGVYVLKNNSSAVFEDITAKLRSLYGDVDYTYETKEGDWKGKKNHRRSNVWYGKNGTMVSVSYYAGCGTTINYSYTGADELLKNASYGNTSGL